MIVSCLVGVNKVCHKSDMIGSCLVGVSKERWMTRGMEEDKRRFLTVICHGLETKKK